MINFLLLAVMIGVAYFVANEGPHGAAVSLVAVLLSGLIAMNFFEPLAAFLSANIANSFEWQHRWDVVALLGIFALVVFLIRLLADNLFPTYAEVNNTLYEISRWGLGLVTGYITMAIFLTSLHVAPLPREFMGFTPEGNNFLSISAPDRQWLAFTQYVSEKSLKSKSSTGGIRVFDGAEFPSNPTDLKTNRVWSSFPIRYAARRELYTTGGATPARPSTGAGSSPPATGAPPGAGSAPNTGSGGF